MHSKVWGLGGVRAGITVVLTAVSIVGNYNIGDALEKLVIFFVVFESEPHYFFHHMCQDMVGLQLGVLLA